MATLFTLSVRDRALLALLGKTPATAAQVLAASPTFGDDPFRDERRVRERMQSLTNAGLVSAYSLGQLGGGLKNYYKPTVEGFRVVHGESVPLPHRSFFAAITPSRLEHTLQLSEVIVRTLTAAYDARIAVTKFYREGALALKAGDYEVQPDCSFQFSFGGKWFNVLFEVDRATESIDALADSSIRRKIQSYEAYQDMVWQQWRSRGRTGPRPAYRIVFLTSGTQRAYHILTIARKLARNPDRRLCYAATSDVFLSEQDALRQPLFLDHSGHWQALVNEHPTATFNRQPVRLPEFVMPPQL